VLPNDFAGYLEGQMDAALKVMKPALEAGSARARA
jgi:hypothetical protein